MRVKSDVAWLRFELAWKRIARKYSPDQPRDDRGRWTDGDGGGAGSGSARTETIEALSATSTWARVVDTYGADGRLAQQTVFNRDGSTIRSEFAAPGSDTGWDERHNVNNPDGSRFRIENSGDTQTIRDGETGEILSRNTWTPDGPVPEATLQQVLDPRSYPAAKAVEALAALYVWLSTRNSTDGTATLDFNAQSFEPGASLQDKAIRVDQLTREQVDEACPRHAEVQARTDQAAEAVRRAGNTLTAQTYGTAVHTDLKQQIDALNDPDFRAEVSAIKSDSARYGQSGSVRIDVLERVGNGTVCVYDIKTGDRGLGARRMAEIAGNVHSLYRDTRRIIVIETRPR